MNEKGKNKREWIKTAAIIFLAIMLVLTFFSNTIMNYSLPEVATQYVQSGSITARIRGTGIVESGDPYEVVINESRKVSSVAVRVGDEVQKGDVILYLAETESEELKAALQTLEIAQDALQTARDNYNDAILDSNIRAEDIQAANGSVSASTYRQQITNAQAAVTAAQAALKPYTDKVAELDQWISDIDMQLVWENAQLELAENRVNAASVSGGNASDLTAAVKVRDDIQNTIASLTNQRSIAELDRYNAQKNADAAAKAVENAEENLANLTNMLSNKQVLDSYLDAIADAQKNVDAAQEVVDELRAKTTAATVTADISGTITAINVVAGNTTTAGSAVAVIQPEGQGYTLSFSVTNDQARRVNVGDRADLVNSWRYDDVDVVLASIKPDPSNPGQSKLLTFNISGGVVAGQTLSLSVGQQSANFDLIVPNSAIREDSNGQFILIVESRSTPLGNRYSASRVDVQVLASDDTQSAISGALYGYEFVITTSTQPVEAGQLVRLADN